MKKFLISNIQYPIFLFVLFFVIFIVGAAEVRSGVCEDESANCKAGFAAQYGTDLLGSNLVGKEDTEFQTDMSKCDKIYSQCIAGQSGGGGSKASSRLKKLGDKAGLANTKPLEQTIGGFIKGALVLVGTIFLILMVYGGYIWMIARGDEAEAKKAKDIITMAVIGMAVVLAAYAVTYFVLSRLINATGTM